MCIRDRCGVYCVPGIHWHTKCSFCTRVGEHSRSARSTSMQCLCSYLGSQVTVPAEIRCCAGCTACQVYIGTRSVVSARAAVNTAVVRGRRACNVCVAIWGLRLLFRQRFAAVSYTHLDVYKRQVCVCACVYV